MDMVEDEKQYLNFNYIRNQNEYLDLNAQPTI